MVQTPPNHQDQLIDQTLSWLRNAIAETETLLPGVESRRPAQPKDVVPETPVHQEQTDSLIDQTLSLVETVTELEEPEQTPSPMPQPVAKQLPSDVQLTEPARNASLINQTLSLVKNVAVPEPKPIEVAPPSSQQPRAKQLTPKERLDMERADIQKRVATFKANQQRFQKEREEYYTTTMAKARATKLLKS